MILLHSKRFVPNCLPIVFIRIPLQKSYAASFNFSYTRNWKYSFHWSEPRIRKEVLKPDAIGKRSYLQRKCMNNSRGCQFGICCSNSGRFRILEFLCSRASRKTTSTPSHTCEQRLPKFWLLAYLKLQFLVHQRWFWNHTETMDSLAKTTLHRTWTFSRCEEIPHSTDTVSSRHQLNFSVSTADNVRRHRDTTYRFSCLIVTCYSWCNPGTRTG